MSQGLYLPDGSFLDFSDSAKSEELFSEFATWKKADEANMLSFLPDPDPVILKRGDNADVLEDLTADDQVCMAMNNRKLRVLNKGDYDFKPGLVTGQEATTEAKNICDDLTKDLEAIDLRNVFSAILDAPFYGYSVLELLWEKQGNKIGLADIVAKPLEWFVFDDKGQVCFAGKNSLDPEPLPPGKFVLARHFPTFKNPYGVRLLSRCLWPVAFKRGGIQFLTRFIEKFGQPWIIAKSSGNEEERVSLAHKLAAAVQDAVAVLPLGAEVAIEAVAGRAGDLHEKYLQRWDKAISKVLMGQTLTSEMDGSGSRAASETHYGVAEDIQDADQFMVCQTMCDIARVYRDINANSGVLAPVFAFNEPQDYLARAQLDKTLHGTGVRFTKAHYARHYGLAEDEFTLPDQSDEAPDFSFSSQEKGQDTIDNLSRTITDKALFTSEKAVQQLAQEIGQAKTREEAEKTLFAFLAENDSQEALAELVAQGLVAANMTGRFELIGGSND